MRILLVVIFFCCVLVNVSDSKKLETLDFLPSNYSQLADAILEASMMELPANDLTTINIISAGSFQSFSLLDFKDYLLLQFFKISKIGVRQEMSDTLNIIRGRRRRHSVLLLNTFQEILLIFKKVKPENFHLNGFYLIVFINGEEIEESEIEKTFKLFSQLKIFNLNVMHKFENDVVQVKTFMPFNNQTCTDTTPILVNKFTNGQFESKDDFFPKKMKNLNKCPIRVSVSTQIQPSVIAEVLPDGSHHLKGFDISVIMTLCEFLNAHINYTYVGVNGNFKDNVPYSGVIKAVIEDVADVSISSWMLKANRLKDFDATTSYVSELVVLLIPSGRDFTALENLIYPFSASLWIVIVSCYLFSVLVIWIVNHQSKSLQNFVYGTNVQHPYMNLFNGFIGGSQKFLPKRNFGRFLLMTFLLYSLIIRTLYQGSFFNILKSNIKHNQVQTVNEIILKDFKIYTFSGGVADALRGVEGLEKK
jgi:hypothetical protein